MFPIWSLVYFLVSSPGPPSPDVTHVQLDLGRSLALSVYWGPVQGADSYIAWTSNGQNCSSTGQSYCFISPVECGQNHSITVTAYNRAGPSSPSMSEDYITCEDVTHKSYMFSTLKCFLAKSKVEKIDAILASVS